MSDISKAARDYKVVGRAALIERIARGAETAIDTLIAAASEGDIRASEAILKKVLPDLKAVDISHTGEGVKIVINQRVYAGKTDQKQVQLPNLTINVTEPKAVHREIDVTPHITASEPVGEAPRNHRMDRKKGVFR